jgi:hypothetical protein
MGMTGQRRVVKVWMHRFSNGAEGRAVFGTGCLRTKLLARASREISPSAVAAGVRAREGLAQSPGWSMGWAMCVNHCGLACDRGGLLTDAEDVWSGGTSRSPVERSRGIQGVLRSNVLGSKLQRSSMEKVGSRFNVSSHCQPESFGRLIRGDCMGGASWPS